ncbi:MAG: hypothetical protein RLO18_10830, partial [Gimesia chilikensis]
MGFQGSKLAVQGLKDLTRGIERCSRIGESLEGPSHCCAWKQISSLTESAELIDKSLFGSCAAYARLALRNVVKEPLTGSFEMLVDSQAHVPNQIAR